MTTAAKTAKTLRCPQCRKPTVWDDNPHRPFCSERCRLLDLGAWADEDYRIAGRKVDPEQAENVLDFPKNH